jgi:hypothetical protein
MIRVLIFYPSRIQGSKMYRIRNTATKELIQSLPRWRAVARLISAWIWEMSSFCCMATTNWLRSDWSSSRARGVPRNSGLGPYTHSREGQRRPTPPCRLLSTDCDTAISVWEHGSISTHEYVVKNEVCQSPGSLL